MTPTNSDSTNNDTAPESKPRRVPLEYIFAISLFGPMLIMLFAMITRNNSLGELGAWLLVPFGILVVSAIGKNFFTNRNTGIN
jgi:hypothetical protein